jgi:hypothetical protein
MTELVTTLLVPMTVARGKAASQFVAGRFVVV